MDKYKTEEDRTLTRKISKLNMHSINKKSSRIGQKFLNTIGKDPAVRMRSLDCIESLIQSPLIKFNSGDRTCM